MIPVKPSQFEELIVQPTDSLCAGIVKTYVRLPILLYKFVKYLWNEDGTITDNFRTQICQVVCPEEE